jgi:hypothetical protein
MTDAPAYDEGLSQRIEAELQLLQVLGGGPRGHEIREFFGRIELRLGDLFGREPDSISESPLPPVVSTAATVGPPAVRPSAPPRSIPRWLREILGWSKALDLATDPADGLALAQSVVIRVQSISARLYHVVSLLDPSAELASHFHRFYTFLSQLLKNALVKVRKFAEHLGVTSVQVLFQSTPPDISVTFTFSGH